MTEQVEYECPYCGAVHLSEGDIFMCPKCGKEVCDVCEDWHECEEDG